MSLGSDGESRGSKESGYRTSTYLLDGLDAYRGIFFVFVRMKLHNEGVVVHETVWVSDQIEVPVQTSLRCCQGVQVLGVAK